MRQLKVRVLLRFTSVLLALILILLAASPADAQGFFAQFKDEEDGAFDISNFVLKASGFMPVPIIITEPAVGFGLGLAPAFFHDFNTPKPVRGTDAAEEYAHHPPSVSAAFAAYTTNSSKIYGGAHIGSYKQDTIRYTGAIGAADLNLKFYLFDNALEFEIEADFLYQEIQFRLGKSHWFLGGDYTFMSTNTVFDVAPDIPEIEPIELDSRNAGLGAQVLFDNTDNFFTATKGQDINLGITRFDENFGGHFDYWEISLKALSYHHLGKKFILGLRLEGEITDGDVPFYGLPFVTMRGIPAMRYQGEYAAALETEGRWRFYKRWTLVGFIGKGWTGGDRDAVETKDNIYAFGGGIRYQIARQLGFDVGIDIARGPEDTAFYLTFGSAW